MTTFMPLRYRIPPVRFYFRFLPSRASVVLPVLYPFLSLRWATLYAWERSRVDAHAHGEACLMGSYRPRGVSNTKAICPLIPGAWRPRLRRALLQQRRIVPGCLKTPSALGGVVPSMVFPSHGYRGITLPAIRWRLAISSPSTVFPTCGYRGGAVSYTHLTLPTNREV